MQSNEQAVYEAIQNHFQSDKRRIRFMALLIIALLKLADSSLAQWSLAINQTTLRASRLKRLQRFVRLFNFSARVYAQVVWQRYGQGNEVVLTLDRTEYKQRGEWIQPGRRCGTDARHCSSKYERPLALALSQSARQLVGYSPENLAKSVSAVDSSV